MVCHRALVKNSSQNNIFINLRQHWSILETWKCFSLPGRPPPGLGSNGCVMQCHNSTSAAVMWCSQRARWQNKLRKAFGSLPSQCQMKADSCQSISACNSWTVQVMEGKQQHFIKCLSFKFLNRVLLPHVNFSGLQRLFNIIAINDQWIMITGPLNIALGFFFYISVTYVTAWKWQTHIWPVATWMDELLIFAATSVASSLGYLHIIMLGNEETLTEYWEIFAVSLWNTLLQLSKRLLTLSSSSSASHIIKANTNLTFKLESFLPSNTRRLRRKYIHLYSRYRDKLHKPSSEQLFQ